MAAKASLRTHRMMKQDPVHQIFIALEDAGYYATRAWEIGNPIHSVVGRSVHRPCRICKRDIIIGHGQNQHAKLCAYRGVLEALERLERALGVPEDWD